MNGAAGFAVRPSLAQREAVAGSASAGATIVAIAALMFGLSGGLLWTAGYNYDGLSGSILTKIHPSTYLAFATFAWTALTAGNPVGFAARCMHRRPGSVVLLLAGIGFLLDVIARSAPGMAGTVDTYIVPGLVAMLMADLDERGMQRLEIALHVLMTVNAAMGILEFVIKARFFPYRFDGAFFPTDTRSAALQGHPLVNAAVTTWYFIALLNGCRTLPEAFRLPLVGLQLAALVTFGGRTAMVLSLILGGMHMMGGIYRALSRGRVPILGAASALMIGALVPAAIVALAAGGFFDDILTRFVSDGGSANARVEMFAIFDNLSWRDILIGPDNGLIETLRRINGLEWGIENPVIKITLYYGALVALFLSVAVILFVWEIVHRCGPGTWMTIIAFIVLVSTSESIAGKTTLLSKFAMMTLCLYRPRAKSFIPGAGTSPAPA